MIVGRVDVQGGESASLLQAFGKSSKWKSHRKDGLELRARSGGP